MKKQTHDLTGVIIPEGAIFIVLAMGVTYRGGYVYQQLARDLAELFTTSNPSFDRVEFLKRCHV
jgi:hypothetical protein